MSFLNITMRKCATLLLVTSSLVTSALHAEEQPNYYEEFEITIEFDEPLQLQLYAMSRAERKARKDIKKHKGKEGLDLIIAKHDVIVREHAQQMMQLVPYFGWPNDHLVGDMGVRAAFQIYAKTPSDLQNMILPYFDETLKEELLGMRKSTADEKSLNRLRAIVAQFGWPSPIVVGTKASVTAFSIVQMSSLPAKKEFWPILVKEYRAGFLSGEHLALLTDSILVEEGKMQTYGTQVSVVEGKVVVSPVADEDALNQRRKRVGLMSMEDYLVTYKDLYLAN